MEGSFTAKDIFEISFYDFYLQVSGFLFYIIYNFFRIQLERAVDKRIKRKVIVAGHPPESAERIGSVKFSFYFPERTQSSVHSKGAYRRPARKHAEFEIAAPSCSSAVR